MFKSNNKCSNFVPISNPRMLSYMNAMEPVIDKPPQCKECSYYTNKNCGSIYETNFSKREFFC